MHRRTLILLSVATIALCAFVASQAAAQDYIILNRCTATHDQRTPTGNFTWQPGISLVHIQDQGGTGGWSERHSFQYTAFGYVNGPNGYAEYGTGDDICIGPIQDLPGTSDYSVLGSAKVAASGNFCLADSPGNYGSNVNASAEITQSFNLPGGADVEFLYFHNHSFRWNNTSDRGYIEVSTNGGSTWSGLNPTDAPSVNYYRVRKGDTHQFKRGGSDLSSFAGQTIKLRFRFDSSSSSHDDGWHIDDVRVIVNGSTVFFDDFESGTSLWDLDNPWNLSVNKSYESNLGSIDSQGLYSVTPVTAPVSVGEGMGFNAVQASYDGLTARAKVYHNAPQYVASPDMGEDDIGCDATVSIEDHTAPVHERLFLDQNSPNPFNPSTLIGFRLENDGRATLRIFDSNGRLVRTVLDNAALPSGEHQFDWDGRDTSGAPQSSGVYLYQLEANGQQVSRKMTLVR